MPTREWLAMEIVTRDVIGCTVSQFKGGTRRWMLHWKISLEHEEENELGLLP